MNRQTKQKTLVILKTTLNFSVIIVVFMNVGPSGCGFMDKIPVVNTAPEMQESTLHTVTRMAFSYVILEGKKLS